MAKPSVFADLGFEDALARSRDTGAILIVDAMAAWCGPCQTMDRTTWVDEVVVERLGGGAGEGGGGGGGAFAIQIDVDAEPEVAGELQVSAMPTLVAFVGGEERDRVVGGRPASAIVEWLDILARGDTLAGAARKAAEELRARGVAAVQKLYAGDHAGALVDYAWLWDNAPTLPDRHTHVVRQLAKLVDEHPPARARIGALRDTRAPRNEPPFSLVNLADWISLSRALGDAGRALDWYVAHADELPATREAAALVDALVVPLLVEHGRWAEAGLALRNPAERFKAALAGASAARTNDEAAEYGEYLQQLAGDFTRASYAAGRDERADDLEFEARAADGSDEMRAMLVAAKVAGRGDRGAWLLARDRFSEAGPLLVDPVEQLRRAFSAINAAPYVTDEDRATRTVIVAAFRTLATRLVRALASARRTDDLRATGALALSLDDDATFAAALTAAGYA